MSRSAKIVLSLLLSGVVVVGAAGVLVWRHLDARRASDDWLEAGKAMLRQGAREGAAMDDAGCIETGFDRLRRDASLGSLQARAWLEGCLAASRPADATCTHVPRPGAVLATRRWAVAFCGSRGFHEHRGCTGLAQTVQQHCAALAESRR